MTFRSTLLTALVLAALPSTAAASHDMVVPRIVVERYVPPHTDGDTDFYGHGPQTKVSIQLEAEGSSLYARVAMDARETGGTTRAKGTHRVRVFTAPAGRKIEAILSPTSATLEYTDKDHEEDYLIPGHGEERPDRWRVSPAGPGPVRMARLVGDTNGGEAGSRTGVQFFLQDVKLRISGDVVPTTNVKLTLPVLDTTTYPNGCAASSGWHLLKYYGRNHTQRHVYDRIASSSNIVSDNNWGVPPGTLKERLKELGASVGEYRVGSKSAALDKVRQQIDAGRPLIALTGWGGKTVKDLYSPAQDWVSWDTGESTLHYVMVYGYDKSQKLVFVIDNGARKTWSYDYFTSVLFWEPEMPHAAGLFAAIEVRNATLIY
jgi:hypothetical protein